MVLLVVLAVTSACAGGTKRGGGEHNTADVTFAQQMIPHHEQAVVMAGLVDGAGASGEVTALAAQITAAQDPEITTMKTWLDDWDADVEPADHDMDMDGHTGMMSGTDLDSLAGLSGAEFDRSWLTMMTAHHEGAVEMAETELREGRSDDARALAKDIIAAQQKEIATMKGLLQ